MTAPTFTPAEQVEAVQIACNTAVDVMRIIAASDDPARFRAAEQRIAEGLAATEALQLRAAMRWVSEQNARVLGFYASTRDALKRCGGTP